MYGQIPDFALIDEIKIRLKSVVKLLTELEEEEFDVVMAEIARTAEEISVMKKEAIERIPAEIMKKNEPELTEITKLIQQLFDNMIQKKTIEFELVKAELGRSANQKKLSTYQR